MRPRLHLWLLAPAAALASLWMAWQLLAAVDFLYPVFYRTMGIHEHIQRFAPENRFRHGFEKTTPAERARLFAGIVDAVQHDGRGLEALRYHDPNGRDLGPLLHESEILHLRDVAHLVSLTAPVGWMALGWTLLHLALIRWRGWPVPRLRQVALATVAVVSVGVLAVLGIGFKPVFYALHEAIFPPGHPWFFYYQDSLMSTMMKAPWLFAGIGATMLVIAVGFYLGVFVVARRLAGPGAGQPNARKERP